jgi:hypothetical protein
VVPLTLRSGQRRRYPPLGRKSDPTIPPFEGVPFPKARSIFFL